jgi:membrane fusion protein (multidrug efflux system)
MANCGFFRPLGWLTKSPRRRLPGSDRPRPCAACCWRPYRRAERRTVRLHRGCRYMTTGNAYVHAGKLMVAADVLGLVADVAVKESQ